MPPFPGEVYDAPRGTCDSGMQNLASCSSETLMSLRSRVSDSVIIGCSIIAHWAGRLRHAYSSQIFLNSLINGILDDINERKDANALSILIASAKILPTLTKL